MILLRPVDKAFPVSQRYGENPHLYPSTHGHNGIDYALPEGSRVYAAAAGQVIRAELDTETASNPRAGYGVHVRIQHNNGYVTIYGHLTSALVKTGQVARMGEPIGISGNTGRSTGPHLHFELRTGPAIMTAIDPEGMIVDEIPASAGLFRARVTAAGAGLRIRTAPKLTGSKGVVRSMQPGETFRVLGLAGDACFMLTDEGYVFYDPRWLEIENQK